MLTTREFKNVFMMSLNRQMNAHYMHIILASLNSVVLHNVLNYKSLFTFELTSVGVRNFLKKFLENFSKDKISY